MSRSYSAALLAAVALAGSNCSVAASQPGHCEEAGDRRVDSPSLIQVGRGQSAASAVVSELPAVGGGVGAGSSEVPGSGTPCPEGAPSGASVVTVKLSSQRRDPLEGGAASGTGSVVQLVAAGALGTSHFKALSSHGLVLGFIYGLIHVIAPDHLAILAALSTSAKPSQAFAIGSIWGLGHCLGMVVVALVVFTLGQVATCHMEEWETAGDYAIGISMIMIGLYFAFNESSYVQTGPDGSCTLKSCEHDHGVESIWRSLFLAPSQTTSECEQACGEVAGKPAATFECALCTKRGPVQGAASFAGKTICADCHSTLAPVEDRPAARPEEKSRGGAHGAGVTLLGVFQGICCPRSLMGLGFMAVLPLQGLVCFVAIYLMISVLGRGLLAATWAWLAQMGLGTCLPVKVMYRASYFLTLLLGVVWTWATFAGFVDVLEYTEALSANHAPTV